MAEACGLGEALPLYVVDPAEEQIEEGERPAPPERRHVVQHGLVAVGRAAHELSERWAAPAAGSPPPGAYESLRGVVIHITRHLVIAPGEAAEAFDRWLGSAGGRVDTPRGSLRFVGPQTPSPSQLRSVPARLVMRLSPVPLPVELELMAWGEWRTVLILHPDRRVGWTVGPHRRSRYFAAGHATMDTIIHRLRALVGARLDRPPYDGAACGPSSSTPTRATTA